MAEINYHPQFGTILANGNLRIPTSGQADDGEKWDGTVEIAPDHPNYSAWYQAVQDKECSIQAMGEETKLAREKRRQKSKRQAL